MQQFTVHRGTAAPLRRRDIDTDQLIPGEYCKRTGRTGYADALFANWREEPGYLLAKPEYADASVLVTGPNFGIGSSREHAVWALLDHGFRAVVAPSFSDIFRGNALNNGLLPVEISSAAVERCWQLAEDDPAAIFTVDLESCVLRCRDAAFPFAVNEYNRRMLLRGWDDITMTLSHESAIAAYEKKRPMWLPRTLLAV
ncbi:3-isopropylmalate dehydratase small subunit [Streptomyces sp. TM32]|uniref:3-isopropylmalate dehydratase small subunit n=1 Tax=Streptomyces sp. TM32 TaxID=1652669 RepID=UPI0010124CD5|nr:3-isopropylmalate dehydratase small subunit [Streptomyces sp. TM32]RXS84641.1 3-isopropylmalate dehydratase small subunit [Streptomyces sp. TM32]